MQREQMWGSGAGRVKKHSVVTVMGVWGAEDSH